MVTRGLAVEDRGPRFGGPGSQCRCGTPGPRGFERHLNIGTDSRQFGSLLLPAAAQQVFEMFHFASRQHIDAPSRGRQLIGQCKVRGERGIRRTDRTCRC